MGSQVRSLSAHLVLDTAGMAMLVGVDDQTSYSYLITAFVVMGLGMGSTMMPVFTAALASLKQHDIARGSTLMNITQQIAISMGTALFSVLLTNAYNTNGSVVGPTLAIQNAGNDPAARQQILDQLGIPASRADGILQQGLHFMGQSFGSVFLVATALVGLCLAPALLLPRKPAEKPVENAAAMIVT